jgi:hypothetical protein
MKVHLSSHKRDRLVIPECKQKMTSLRGQASSAKMTSLGGKGLFTHPILECDFAVSQ